MKAKNKYQENILKNSQSLRTLTIKEENWAIDNCFKHYAYRLKSGKTTCMECGEVMNVSDEKCSKINCSHCGKELIINNTMTRKSNDASYASFITIKKGFQVQRVFLLKQFMNKGKKAEYYFYEIFQRWLDEKGKMTYVGVRRRLSYFYDAWQLNDTMEIRRTSNDIRDIVASSSWVYPKIKLLPIIKRNGFSWRIRPNDYMKCFQGLLAKPMLETLAKAKEYSILKYFIMKGINSINEYWSSLRICLKRKYKIYDISMWCDMVNLLKDFGKDILNYKFICPSDLRLEHDKWMMKKRKIQEREWKIEEEKRRIEKEERRKQKGEDFVTLKKKYFNLNFTNGNIVICVLKSLDEFKNEGEVLHHCVYQNEYYSQKDSLILSARDKENNPIETIELSLETMEILQSRGKFNQSSEHHQEIINLIKANILAIQMIKDTY